MAVVVTCTVLHTIVSILNARLEKRRGPEAQPLAEELLPVDVAAGGAIFL